MSTATLTAPPTTADDVGSLVECGAADARAIAPPEVRDEHLAAWALRAAWVAPSVAERLIATAPLGTDLAARVYGTMAQRALELGQASADSHWCSVVERIPRCESPDLQLELFNQLCEAAIARLEDQSEHALRLLRSLEGVIDGLVPGESAAATQALASALLGEALVAAGDAAGEPLLDRAVSLSEGLYARDQVLQFVAQAHAGRDAGRAAALADAIENPWARLDARLGLLERLASEEEDLRDPLLCGAAIDAGEVEPPRQVEARTRVAAALAARQPERAREMVAEAIAALPEEGAQLRALQLAGVAASVSTWDSAWGDSLYEDALRVAGTELEVVRRAVARIAIAYQMGHADPARAQPVLEAAIAEAKSAESTWELAHVLDVLFETRGRPSLDLRPASALLEAALARVSEDEPRLPGVFGLPEAARCFAQIDLGAAARVCRRWLAAAERSGDVDGLMSATLALAQLDPERAPILLRGALRHLVERGDCVSLSHFCGAAAAHDPGLAAAVADRIPASRERTRSLAGAAAGAWKSEPGLAYRLFEDLPGPEERSVARITLVDHLLGTEDLPRPYSESEFSSCCSQIPRLDEQALAGLRALAADR